MAWVRCLGQASIPVFKANRCRQAALMRTYFIEVPQEAGQLGCLKVII